MRRRCLQKMIVTMTVGLTLMVGLCLALKCSAEGDFPADFKNYTETLTTLDGIKITLEMIAVPGGTFTMGSPASEKGRKTDEGPQRKVTVGPFWICKTEVTWDEYDTFMGAAPQTPKGDPGEPYEADAISGPTLPYGDQYRGFSSGKKPAIGIGWYGAMVYCKWLSKETGKLYRLPTEAEWEYACRAGSTGKYSFGDDESKLGDYAWYVKNAKNTTHDVGTKKPNAWGIHDMHGNVGEWCLDWYGAKYPAGNEKDPKGAAEGKNHLVRGGSWKSTPSQARSARRDSSKDWWLVPDPQEPKSKWWLVPTNFLGFRVIRPLEGEKPTMPDIEEGRKGL